ncbi:hypothetical protein ON010_g18033 [Phytophthora cinnamomi]|nr:hypothetical protein ON010_g18033 [Phytophthora cinnamomi]
MVLARKRKRDEQRRLLNGKKLCTDSDGSECNAADSEQDSLDMEEQLTAFVEYWVLAPDVKKVVAVLGEASKHRACFCVWVAVNQFQEEASEVFDSELDPLISCRRIRSSHMAACFAADVIYAPRPASVPAGSNASTYCRPQGKNEFGIARPSFLPARKTIPEKRAVCSPPSDDSEDSLSDGFDVSTNLASKLRRVEENHADTSAKQAAKPLWTQRRSVKRDCSFLDNSNYSVNGRLLLMASPTPATASEASEASSDRVIELKDGCFDSSDDVQEIPMRDGEVSVSNSVPSSMPTTVDTMTVVSSSFSSGPSSLPAAFQPRLVRKRRKVGQLTLDGFFRSK